MSCGGGCCQKKNYNSDKPLSKRIPQVLLVFFVVWLIGFGYLAQAFNQPSQKPKRKKRHNKKRYNHNPGFFERLNDGFHNGDRLVWGLILFIVILAIFIIIRIIRLQTKRLEHHIQDKWEEAMAEQQRRYTERMNAYSSNYNYDEEDDDDDYNGPRIRELETEEEEAHWRSLIEKEKRERERQIAEAAAELEEERKKTK